MLGAITASMSSSKAIYVPGDAPIFSIVGGAPGSRIVWTSWKNGQLVEDSVDHGEVIGANGTAQLQQPAFTEADAGYWERQAVLLDDATGSHDIAQVFFSVNAVATAQPVVIPPQPGFFDSTVNIFGAQIPTWLLLGGFLAIVLFKRH